MISTINPVTPVQIGSPAVDCELLTVEGEVARLSKYWSERPLVLVFLRHLGCTFCRQQLARLRAEHSAFQKAGASIVCIAQGGPKVGKAYAIAFDLPFPLLMCGDNLEIYRRYGLLRGKALQLLNPVLLSRAFVSFLQGHIQTRIEGDGGQLGGGFIVDTDGIVRFAYRSKDASDIVSTVELLSALRSLR